MKRQSSPCIFQVVAFLSIRSFLKQIGGFTVVVNVIGDSRTGFKITVDQRSMIGRKLDLFPNKQNFDLDKSRQTFHHSLKEHTKLVIFRSFVAKCCKMLII